MSDQVTAFCIDGPLAGGKPALSDSLKAEIANFFTQLDKDFGLKSESKVAPDTCDCGGEKPHWPGHPFLCRRLK